ncbi:hypothetical protein [Desulfosporosinus sp.]|nr:hypothetical protein [Desulfosporosinus sp.]
MPGVGQIRQRLRIWIVVTPFGTAESGFTMDNIYADLDVFGVEIQESEWL